jgi:hypothetical protein
LTRLEQHPESQGFSFQRQILNCYLLTIIIEENKGNPKKFEKIFIGWMQIGYKKQIQLGLVNWLNSQIVD